MDIWVKKYPKIEIKKKDEESFEEIISSEKDLDELRKLVNEMARQQDTEILKSVNEYKENQNLENVNTSNENEEILNKDQIEEIENKKKIIKDISSEDQTPENNQKTENPTQLKTSEQENQKPENLSEILPPNLKKKTERTEKLLHLLNTLEKSNNKNKKSDTKKKTHINTLYKKISDFKRQLKFSQLKRSDTKIPPSCNAELINGFGVYGKRIKNFKKMDTFCRRNPISCCDQDHIESTQKSMQNGVDELTGLYDAVEETFSLFKGPKINSILAKLKNSERCFYIIQNHDILEFENPKHFFEEFTKKSLRDIKRIIFDLKAFVLNNKSYYANVLCTICNPYNTKFFDLNEKGSSIIANSSNCMQTMEILDFELRMMKVFNNFIKVITDLYKCEKNWTADSNYGVNPLEYHKIDHLITDFKECFQDLDLTKKRCLDLCKIKNFGIYKLPIHFFESLIRAAKVLFPAFLDISLEQYYKETGRENPFENVKDKIIYFYPVNNPSYIKYKMDNFIWKFDNLTGIRISANKMSHSFYKSGVGLMIFWSLFLMLF